jgi:hypothetical protein
MMIFWSKPHQKPSLGQISLYAQTSPINWLPVVAHCLLNVLKCHTQSVRDYALVAAGTCFETVCKLSSVIKIYQLYCSPLENWE